MKINGIKHIFFDLDHTLWDFDKNSALTFEKIFDIHRVTIDTSRFLSVYEPINLNYWKMYREERISKKNLRYQRLRDTFDAVNFDVTDEIIHKLSEDYINYLTTFNHLFEGTIDILEHLFGDYDLHIITNGFEEAQQRKINNANIGHYFKTITNSEAAGVKKPNPIIFNHALNVANADPNESLMIGDNYEADILGALDVGLDAILFNYHNYTDIDHIKQVKHLSDLKVYL
ncbi:YjjG family noncanonical pyrimidine nucleotidase [Psychroserpens sp.]|uniref:YjjG family noncanonical pyrimidine nucleotidase n=1 Tax=Psychroserpens sp. TaxID=2020870 RepID=UPI001B0581F3|nr:YjjG family noncanonical pyrimidine nucleotidase [Psychroserpens sp.]MBO6606203.1 YjjG family noncanonical pyrimidine nucleotidase [Psychroserpens sp.]MBO6652425.1 YjjG family noncanonical pyrimidine nucleotidase [Psychroserpens sp.]MBO6681803.1 YjjG family noncanonical pyrimidine nucleotidase [Psychroserpens sp.]MBO6749578.1 YjjG family noncanonical pyrimidine nucleotidase [Psychroserpens sp.]MBO6913977.1 YjjG family noncanonical pyrimidine nucleotidase [Psychroserpens sp.]